MFGLLNPVAGDHRYAVPPDALNCALCPMQMVALFTETTGSGLTFTVTCADAVHPFRFPMTVYIVVVAGFDVTEFPDAELSELDGDHE